MSEGPVPPDPSLHRLVTIANKKGLHARAAARFVQCAERFEAEITVVKQEISVSGRSIMGLLLLAAEPGTELSLHATGPQAEAALTAIIELIEGKFGEE